jgi:hypothetical protein
VCGRRASVSLGSSYPGRGILAPECRQVTGRADPTSTRPLRWIVFLPFRRGLGSAIASHAYVTLSFLAVPPHLDWARTTCKTCAGPARRLESSWSLPLLRAPCTSADDGSLIAGTTSLGAECPPVALDAYLLPTQAIMDTSTIPPRPTCQLAATNRATAPSPVARSHFPARNAGRRRSLDKRGRTM